MTETNAVIGGAGRRPAAGVDGHVCRATRRRSSTSTTRRLPDGTPGELVLRADEPFAFATGYWRMPEKTVESWRNLWFHTGDRAVRDPDGCFRFLDRMKDAIRRRGENISALEVEQVLVSHPDVAAARGRPRCRRSSARTRSWPCVVLREGRARRAGGADPPLRAAARVLRDPALPRVRRRAAADRERQGAQVRAARRGRHRRGVGPRGGRVRPQAVTDGRDRRRRRVAVRAPPGPRHDTTESLLADAFLRALGSDGHRPLRRSTASGVASFTLAPDHAIDLAWRLGLRVRWLMDDANGGASGINMLQHAVRAIEAGDATTIVLLAGDRLLREEFATLVEQLQPRDARPPRADPGRRARTRVFALLTQRHMAAHGPRPAPTTAAIPVAQRRWAGGNPLAVYREPLTLEEYLASPFVAEPLCRYDCVPVVTGADALVVTSRAARARRRPRARDPRRCTTPTGRRATACAPGSPASPASCGRRRAAGPADVDLAWVYDDYPAMVLAQLADLGFVPGR